MSRTSSVYVLKEILDMDPNFKEINSCTLTTKNGFTQRANDTKLTNRGDFEYNLKLTVTLL